MFHSHKSKDLTGMFKKLSHGRSNHKIMNGLRSLSAGAVDMFSKIHHIGKVQPSYRQVEALLKKNDIEGAEQELYWIIEEYPEDVKPHIELISIAIKFRKDQHMADMRMLHAVRKFENDDDQNKLKRAYNKLSPRSKEHIHFAKEPVNKAPKAKLKPIKRFTPHPSGH